MSLHSPMVFFGTPELAVYVLEELEAAGIVPDVVVCAPDAPKGRKLILTPPPVADWARERGIPILQPERLKDPAAVPELANTEWEVFIVAAYAKLLPAWLLALPRRGVLNVHPSLLPKLRGPSPIRTAIREDVRDAVGVTVIRLDEEMDHGPIVAQATVSPDPWPLPGHILDELLFREGGRLLAEALPLWLAGSIEPEEQKHDEATYTKKLTKADGEIRLDGDAWQNWLAYCAYDGWPGTYFFETKEKIQETREHGKTRQETDGVTDHGDTRTSIRVKIAEAEYVDGEFRILKVVPEGKKEMSWEEWARSARMGDGNGNGANE